jgi:hypothetical protein
VAQLWLHVGISDQSQLVKVHNEGLRHPVKHPLLLSIPLVSWTHVALVVRVSFTLGLRSTIKAPA